MKKLIYIGKNAKKAASIEISAKEKNRVLSDYCKIILKNKVNNQKIQLKVIMI
jgi:hypothetical protein